MNQPSYDNLTSNETALYGRQVGVVGSTFSLGVSGLSCSRNDKVLFNGLQFSVHGGQLLQIEGENGSGKTSLLRTLCGFIQPDQGEVLWQGVNIRHVLDEYLASLHYVGHSNGIKLGLSCRENLSMASRLAVAVRSHDITAVLHNYGLGEHEDTLAQMLSSGQRRRLALARLSICQAQLWILDEPFTSLDEKGKGLMKAIFHQHLQSGGMIVMTSHEDLSWDAENILKVGL